MNEDTNGVAASELPCEPQKTECKRCGNDVEKCPLYQTALGVNACPAPNWLTLAKQCGGTTYTNRHLPGEPAVAFGNESWARFTEALTKLTSGVTPCVPPSLTDEQIDGIWDGIEPQGDPSGHKFARAFARAVLAHGAKGRSE